jgi:DNA modification methylase
METRHRIYTGDTRSLDRVADDSVELVVTSPPYPMIELWDDVFADLNPEIGAALDAGAGGRAFDLMHDVLDSVWAEVERVLVDEGVVIGIEPSGRKRSVEPSSFVGSWATWSGPKFLNWRSPTVT